MLSKKILGSFSSLVFLCLIWTPPAALAQGEEQGARPGLAVVVQGDGLPEAFLGSMRESAETVAAEKGYRVIGRDGGEAEAEVRVELVESEGVLEAGVTAAAQGLELGSESRQVTRASAAAQVRAMIRSYLPTAGSRPAPEASAPVPAPEEPRPAAKEPLPAPEQTRPAPVETVPAPAVERRERIPGRAPPRPTKEELMAVPPGRVMAGAPPDNGRIGKVFGVTAGVQGGAYLLSLLTWAVWALDDTVTNDDGYYDEDGDYHSSSGDDESTQNNYDRAFQIGCVYYALSPAISSIAGSAIGRRSPFYHASYGVVVAGAYLGALAGFGITTISYFAQSGVVNMFGFVLVPIVFPAAGAAIGYGVGRKVKEGVVVGLNRYGEPSVALSRGVEWTLPSPIAIPAMDGSRRSAIGVSLGRLRF